MAAPTLNYVSCPDAGGGHRMAWWQWGDAAAAHLIVCAHGLSRQGRDFDVLAQALVERAGGALRVACPDVVGRGQSDWLRDPMGYQIGTYVGDMLQMLGQLNAQAPVATLDWVGTSMGGLIGMGVCGTPKLPLPAPVRGLVLNDVGPVIQYDSLLRIGSYLGAPKRYASLEEAADYLWSISQGFGPHTREQWLALTRPQLKPDGDGFIGHYDPRIALPFKAVTPELAAAGEALLWMRYDAVRCPTLLIRGAQSDLLSHDTAVAMTLRGPKARLVELEGVGHAPTLVAGNQVAIVKDFLLA